jgi:hypothetical protein
VPLQIDAQHAHVLFGGVVPHEAGRQLAGGIVDHVDQIDRFATAFQPVVRARVPLNQLSPATAALPPRMHRIDFPPACTPQTRGDHDLPQRLAPDVNAVIVRRILAGQRGAEVPVDLLRKNPDHLLANLHACLVVGTSAAQLVNHRPVSVSLQLLQ